MIRISSTMVTVIALLLGLAVVAPQWSSTQFSPRLLRNFLRGCPNQIVLSVFVGTFAYSTGGLFEVGILGPLLVGRRVPDRSQRSASRAPVAAAVHRAAERLDLCGREPVDGADVFVGDSEELADVRWVRLTEADDAFASFGGMFPPVHEYLRATLTA